MCIVQIDSIFFVVYKCKTRHMSALTKFVQKRPEVIVGVTVVLMVSTAAALVYIMTQCQRDNDEPRPCDKVTGTIVSPDWTKRLKALTDTGNNSDIFTIVSRNWNTFDGNTCTLNPIDPPAGAPAGSSTGTYYGAPALSVLWDADAGAVSLVSQPPGSITTSVGDDGVVTFLTGAHFAFFMKVLRSAISADTPSPTAFVRNYMDADDTTLTNVVVKALQMNPETDIGENEVPDGCATEPDQRADGANPQQAGTASEDEDTVWFLIYAKLPTEDSVEPSQTDISDARNALVGDLESARVTSAELGEPGDSPDSVFVFSAAYPLEDQESPPAVFQMSFTGPTC